MVGTGKGAQAGVLIRSTDALETAHKLDTIVLDKTGIITANQPSPTSTRSATSPTPNSSNWRRCTCPMDGDCR